MLGKYSKIERIYFKDGTTSYFLVDTNNNDYDCDVLSEFWFNEYAEKDILKRVFYKNIYTLNELILFLNKQKINYDKFYINKTLLIGGEHDMQVNEDLSYRWCE